MSCDCKPCAAIAARCDSVFPFNRALRCQLDPAHRERCENDDGRGVVATWAKPTPRSPWEGPIR